MDNTTIEVAKKSLSRKGIWVRQTTGEEPDFTNLKFSIELSDNSTIDYPDWESFKSAGGDYRTEGGDKWKPYAKMQSIVFFLEDAPEIRISEDVEILRKPYDIEITSIKKQIYSEDSVSSDDFEYKIRFTDKSIKIPSPEEITVSPEYIPMGTHGNLDISFTYSEEGLPITVNKSINIKERIHFIKVEDSELGKVRVIIGGKEMNNAYYRCSLEDPIEIRIRAIPLTENHRFREWMIDSDDISLEDSSSPETIMIVPAMFNRDIRISAVWDDSITDKYGNIFSIKNRKLNSVELVSDKVCIPYNVERIASSVFKNSSIKEVEFPVTLSTIDSYAFQGCSGIMTLELPRNLTSIGNQAFKDCTSLKSVKFNQTSPIRLGKKAFYGCSSLSELDFLSMKDKFKNCEFGDSSKDVWTGCRLRTVKITKNNFSKSLCSFTSDRAFTMRVPFKAIMSMNSKNSTVRIRAIGTTDDGTNAGISKDYTRKNVYSHTFDKNNRVSSTSVISYFHNKEYDMRESLGCYVVSDGPCEFNAEILGLGNSEFNYEFYISVASKYEFTTIGGDSFFYEGEIGEGFINWDMMGYVNSVLYPNIKDENENSLINRMIPLYNRRIF